MSKKKAAPEAETQLTKKQLAEKKAQEDAERLAAEQAEAEAADKKGKGKSAKGKGEKASEKEPAEPEQEPEPEPSDPAKGGKPRSLKAIASAITKKIMAGARVSVEIGLLLAEGKATIELKNSKGATKAFLIWAEEQFGIKKAMVYTYLKIATVFGSEEMQEKFSTVPLLVLNRLTMNDDMLDAAADAIEQGVKVDSAWMKEWIDSNREEDTGGEGSGKGSKGDEEGDVDGDEEPGAGSGSGKGSQDDAFIQQLEAEVEELKAKLEAAGSGVIAQDHFGAVAKRMSKLEPYQVLGVAPDADKKAVKAAMRDLIKLYHPDIVGAAGAEVVQMVEAASKAMAG